ncbi:hypothetical protein LV779_01765 [Streptomyces thinghirensis]|nr:hypothetical protein [Streptomyces thinghirensis]
MDSEQDTPAPYDNDIPEEPHSFDRHHPRHPARQHHLRRRRDELRPLQGDAHPSDRRGWTVSPVSTSSSTRAGSPSPRPPSGRRRALVEEVVDEAGYELTGRV